MTNNLRITYEQLLSCISFPMSFPFLEGHAAFPFVAQDEASSSGSHRIARIAQHALSSATPSSSLAPSPPAQAPQEQSQQCQASLPKIIGRAKVIRRATKDPVDVLIQKTTDTLMVAIREFQAVLRPGDEPLGSIKVVISRKIPCSGPFVHFEKYQEGVAKKVFVWGFQSYQNDTYSGIGSALFQVAIEYGFRKKCKGRLCLDALPSSQGFYFKQGLRSADDPVRCLQALDPANIERDDQTEGPLDPRNLTDCAIEQEVSIASREGRKPNTTHLPQTRMFLPQEAIDRWALRILPQPILFSEKVKKTVLSYLAKKQKKSTSKKKPSGMPM